MPWAKLTIGKIMEDSDFRKSLCTSNKINLVHVRRGGID